MGWTATAFTLCASLRLSVALNNGLGLTPQMGYNTWNDFRCDGLTEDAVKKIADRIVELGLDKLGYKYLNIDDCWSRELSPDGLLIEDPAAFPRGSKDLEHHHAKQFAEWGIDYVKEDSCFASNNHNHAFAEYSLMRDALNSTGRPIFFSLCGWNAWYAPRGGELANSWRIAPDCDEWANVYVAIRTNEPLYVYAGPGGWNDPDMLVGSHPDAAVHFTPQQVQTQFSMWAVMASPLLIGSSILRMPESDLATYSNEEVIRINQDPLGVQGVPVWSNCPLFHPRDNWWMAPWTMPQDVAKMWTAALSTFLAAAFGAIVLVIRALLEPQPREPRASLLRVGSLVLLARAMLGRPPPAPPPADKADDRPDQTGPILPKGGMARSATELPTPCEPLAGSKTAGVLKSRGCLAALVALLVILSVPAFTMLVAIHAMKPQTDPCQQVWMRPLDEGAAALCMVNFAPHPTRIQCSAACLLRAGFPHGVYARDVVARQDLGRFDSIELEIPGDGGSILLRLSAKS